MPDDGIFPRAEDELEPPDDLDRYITDPLEFVNYQGFEEDDLAWEELMPLA